MSRKSLKTEPRGATEPYGPAFRLAAAQPEWAWLTPLLERGRDLLEHARHGDLARWQRAIASLPETGTAFSLEGELPSFGRPVSDERDLIENLKALHPWRKGPMKIGGVLIDTEWRSDWKWRRIGPHVDLQGHRVLDIGCGNGYYGWRMLGQGAELVLGLDPTLVYSMQWLACRHFAGESRNMVIPLGIEDLPAEAGGFDSVFSMGVLYHRRDPVAHLRHAAALVKPGGQVVLETLILEDESATLLLPDNRYASMRNVWALPSARTLRGWMTEAGLTDIQQLDISRTTTDEQRSTEWMTFQSLDKSLDHSDPTRTIEGYPAPVRMMIRATTALI